MRPTQWSYLPFSFDSKTKFLSRLYSKVSHQDDSVSVLIQLAEHEVKVGLLGKLLQRVRRLDHPEVGLGGVEAALGRENEGAMRSEGQFS